MKEYIRNFFDIFEYPAEAKEALTSAFDKIYETESAWKYYDELLREYEENDAFQLGHVLNDSTVAAREAGVLDDQGTFLIFCCFSKHLREMYVKRRVDEKVWYDSMCDLRIKAVECKNVKGYWGSFVSGWFGGFFDMTRFALGRLQFEKISYPDDWNPYIGHGISVGAGNVVVNVHIPSGGRLPYEAVLESYKQAYIWYKDTLRDGKLVIVCSSWLMYDKMPEIAGEGTNTYNFIMDYETVVSYENEPFVDCWRLFDVYYTGDPSVLPRSGGLRRRYAEWLEAGNKAGAGCAVAIFDGEKMITRK